MFGPSHPLPARPRRSSLHFMGGGNSSLKYKQILPIRQNRNNLLLAFQKQNETSYLYTTKYFISLSINICELLVNQRYPY